MPKKKSSWGEQNYVPAGNGDASGEYADEATGSNIHFTNFSKPDTEAQTKLTSLKTKMEGSKSAKQQKFDEFVENLLLDEEFSQKSGKITTEQKIEEDYQDLPLDETGLDMFVIKNEDKNIDETQEFDDLIDSELDDNETKQAILNLNDNLSKEKVDALDEKQAKKLLKAIELSENAQKKYDKLKKGEKKFEGIWNTEYSTPSLLLESKGKENLLNSIQLKKDYFLQKNDTEKLALLDEAEQAINSYIAKKEKLDAKVKKANDLIAKYDDPNNTYSKSRKDKAVWCQNTSETKATFPPVSSFNVSATEIEALKEYTSSYHYINEPLRNTDYIGPSYKKDKFVGQVENMTKAIDKCVIPFDFWTQRGTTAIQFPNTKISSTTSLKELQELVGTAFEDQAFVSTGAAKGTGFTGMPIMLNIYCPKGTKGAYINSISAFPGKENEVLLQRGYSYKVTKVEKTNGTIYMDCDLILDSDKNKYNKEQLEVLKNKYFD